MKLNTKLMGLALTSLVYSTTALAAVQEVKPSQSTFNVPAGNTVEFTVSYTAESPHGVTGFGVQLYYDSTKLSLNSISNPFTTGAAGAVSDSNDTNNDDSDAATDKKIVAAWFDLNGNWPGQDGEIALYTVNFTANADTTINFTGDPSAGNTFAATPVTVTVITPDTTAPTITAPADVTAVATGPTTTVSLGTPTVTDDKDPSPVASNDAPAAGFPLGDTTVTWTATDASGNVSTPHTQKVTITDPGIPKLNAPAAVTAEATGPTTTVNLVAPSVNDVIDGVIQATADNSGPFPLGDTTVTWTVKNSRGATSTATQKVTIQDTTGPKITVPADVTVTATGATTAVDVGTATATDLVDGSVAVTSDAATSYAVGEHTVTWTSTDKAGNTSTATQKVTVKDPDTEGPVVTAPADIVKEATGPTTPVDLGTATATDTVDGSLTPTADKTGPFAVGEHTVTWTATDAAGNPGTDTQKVTITDKTKPDSLVVPDSKTVVLPLGGTGAIVDLGDATAHDVAGGNLIPEWKATMLSTNNVVMGRAGETGDFAAGVWNIVWTATDPSGNSITAERQLNVVSAEANCQPGNVCVPVFIFQNKQEFDPFCEEGKGQASAFGFNVDINKMVPLGENNDLLDLIKGNCP